jgi:hypothetical protein
MRIKSSLGFAIVLGIVVFAAPPASGCLVAGPVPLKELARSADLAIKATVIADRPVTDHSFEQIPGSEVHETEMRVVSIIKGITSNVIEFRHYAPSSGTTAMMMCVPSYAFVVGRTYIVLATRVSGDTYHQLSKSSMMIDRTVLPAANARPLHSGTTVAEAIWGELIAQLKSPDRAVVLRTIRLLDAMSVARPIADFNRSQVLAAIQPLIGAKSMAIATAAITAFGMDSPYFDDYSAPQWLAGIGKGAIPGLAPLRMPATPLSDGAVRELVRVANDNAPPELRALAIRAVARSHAVPPVTIAAWFRDSNAAIRSAAVLASAELPDRQTIKTASTDSSPEVRHAAALAVGFAQDARLVPLLGKLLQDPAANVRAGAALSLVSFAPEQAAQVMKANLATEFGPLFVNALARGNPQPYLPMLAKIINQQLRPANWWGGWTPAVDSWYILFDYIKVRPAAELASGEFDRWLDALERSPAQPTELYALYLGRGLTSRAKQFRAAIRNNPGYIDSVFNTIERDPAAYVQ